MPAVVCPSCHSKLKAPSQLVGRTATCPRCRSAVHVPEAVEAVVHEDRIPHRTAPVAPAEDTVEVAALDDTALQIPLSNQPTAKTAAATPGPSRGMSSLWRAALLAALAASGAFALWMATPPSRQVSRTPQVVQPRR